MPGEAPTQGQLRMYWPSKRRLDPEALAVPDGYVLRTAQPGDVLAFRDLMARVELGTWEDETLDKVRASVVPDGWGLVEHRPSGTVVATGMAQRGPIDGLYPDGYEVGWIAAHPDHSGRGLGRVVTAAATTRLVERGVSCIYLQTDDFRLPAIRTYLRLGFVPHLWSDGMAERWQAVCERLNWAFQPDTWPGPGVPSNSVESGA
jgi:mycothiol synthase